MNQGPNYTGSWQCMKCKLVIDESSYEDEKHKKSCKTIVGNGEGSKKIG